MSAVDLRSKPSAPADLDAVSQAYSRLGGDGANPGAVRAFLAQAFEDYSADETPQIDGEDFACLLVDAWRAAEAQADGAAPTITVGPLTGAGGRAVGYDLVRIVQADAPFLVDSVLGELAEADVSVRALFHPVVEMGDGRRLSVILLVLDPITQERRDGLGEGLAATLADVRQAVADHPVADDDEAEGGTLHGPRGHGRRCPVVAPP